MAISTVNIAETAYLTQISSTKFFVANLIAYLLEKKQVIWTNIEQVTAVRSPTITHQPHSSMKRTKNKSRADIP